MRGAFGKSYLKSSRVYYNTIIASLRVKKEHIKTGYEAMRRGANKIAGRFVIIASNKVGFTEFTA